MPFTPMDMGYKMVADRHAQFVLDYPKGLVMNQVASFNFDPSIGSGMIVMQSQVWKDRADADAGKLPDGIGHASMPIPGPTSFTKNSEAENAETSALGRALAMIGYHAKETMASEDEILAKGGGSASRVPKPATSSTTEEDPMKGERAKIMNWGRKVFGDTEAVKKFLSDEFGVKSSNDISADNLKAIKEAIAIHGATKEVKVPSGVTFDE